MTIAGHRWVRGLVPDATYESAFRAKGKSTWDEFIASALQHEAERCGGVPEPATPLPAALSAAVTVPTAVDDTTDWSAAIRFSNPMPPGTPLAEVLKDSKVVPWSEDAQEPGTAPRGDSNADDVIDMPEGASK